jgi:hypothetical protein
MDTKRVTCYFVCLYGCETTYPVFKSFENMMLRNMQYVEATYLDIEEDDEKL